MKRIFKIFILATMVLLSSHLSAQLAGGIEGAITTSSVKITDLDNKFADVIKGDNIMGYEAGFFIRGNLIGPVYLKPKLLLNYESGSLSYVTIDEQSQSATFRAGKIVFPILLGVRFLPPLSLEGGPVFNRILFVTKDFNGNHLDIEKGGLGYRIGLNATLSILSLTVSYQGMRNKGSLTSTSTYQAPSEIIFGLGLQF